MREILLLFLLPAVLYSYSVKELPEKYRKWLEEEVVYIITPKEKEIFVESGRKGYLTDRGRIYILFGPPDEAVRSEGGQYIDPFADARTSQFPTREGSKPIETWICRNILIGLEERIYVRFDFADVDGTGDYKLITDLREAVPGKLSTVITPNLILLHELNKEEFYRKRLKGEKPFFDFNYQFKRVKSKEGNLVIHLEFPLRNIYLEEAGILKTELRIDIKIMDRNKKVLWEFKKDYPFIVTRLDLSEGRIQSWIIDIPVTETLPSGSYNVCIISVNTSGNEEIKKLLPLKI